MALDQQDLLLPFMYLLNPHNTYSMSNAGRQQQYGLEQALGRTSGCQLGKLKRKRQTYATTVVAAAGLNPEAKEPDEGGVNTPFA